MTGDLVTSLRLGDGFPGPGGHSANLEARRLFLRGSWRSALPPSQGSEDRQLQFYVACNAP